MALELNSSIIGFSKYSRMFVISPVKGNFLWRGVEMQKVFGIAVLSAVALSGVASISQAAQVKVPVVAGAKALSAPEKGTVNGMGDPSCPPPPPPPCPPLPVDTKPGYGFGTTGHYGPPGQGFVPTNSWRAHVANGITTTPKGKAIPPRAFR